MIPYVNLRLKFLMKILLALCLVIMVGLLLSRKEQMVNNISPRWTAYYNSQIDLIKNYIDSKIIEKKEERPEMTIQHSTESLQPEGANTTFSPKPIENVRESSTVTGKNTKTISKPQNNSIKLQNKLAKSHVTTQRPNVKTKPQNAITTKPIPEPTKKSSPSTTFDYLGNKYGTDETHVHSKCPNRIRDKLRSKEFQNMFLEKIPVLQWKKHAQESEYERLKKYSGAQGWMGVTWEIINKTLNLLNSTGNAYMFDTWQGQSPCIRCAVVGNGGILNGSGMGQEIDSHDYVFRMNGAITKGFEKDVGNRTSFYSFSTNTLMNSLYAYGHRGFKAVPRTPETRYVVLPDHDRDYLLVLGALTNTIIDKGGDKGKDPAKYFGKNLTTEHFKILHPDFMRYLRNRFLYDSILKTKSRDIYRPSTGASLLLAAIHTCDQVSAYGFMTPSYEKYSDHYFDTTYHKVVFYSNHSFRKEMMLWQKLHEAGVIKLYMRG
ncbi:alpha-N-acetylgalactosaminide alpha-2,6-sialyltransferase 2-like isoform X1 [Ranitomeya imitator]|uniref:alpha-N-acetylgalactosaminide alpha-2,6-sialyltransferase 2-like isoform X1 n=1 Tax=Ranitomeya imitator TaxID=111125 RepID=UPI0037E814B3